MRPAAALDAMHRRETAGQTGLNAGRAAVSPVAGHYCSGDFGACLPVREMTLLSP